MKKIEAIIRKSKFDEVRKALHNADIDFLSWWEVKGQGTATQGLIFRGIAYDVNAIDRIFISFVVREINVQKSIDAILESAYTGEAPITPHNIPFVVIGTALLWMGWLGFNGGSGLAADGISANAILVTNLAAAAAALTWSLLDQIINKKPTVVGFCTGVIAGLVAITPAAGSTGVFGGIVCNGNSCKCSGEFRC
jgi:nitrogen regulatory protein PII